MLTGLAEAQEMWEAQFTESGQQQGEGVGTARRYLSHHLLTGAVLSVWSKIEAVYAMYNSGSSSSGSNRVTVAARLEATWILLLVDQLR